MEKHLNIVDALIDQQSANPGQQMLGDGGLVGCGELGWVFYDEKGKNSRGVGVEREGGWWGVGVYADQQGLGGLLSCQRCL